MPWVFCSFRIFKHSAKFNFKQFFISARCLKQKIKIINTCMDDAQSLSSCWQMFFLSNLFFWLFQFSLLGCFTLNNDGSEIAEKINKDETRSFVPHSTLDSVFNFPSVACHGHWAIMMIRNSICPRLLVNLCWFLPCSSTVSVLLKESYAMKRQITRTFQFKSLNQGHCHPFSLVLITFMPFCPFKMSLCVLFLYFLKEIGS